MQRFEELVGRQATLAGTGWEFAWLDGRAMAPGPSWSYPGLARSLTRHATGLLDLDTGNGEMLAELAPLPPHTVAVEGWTHNVAVARDRLGPYRVSVVSELPSGEEMFDVVLSRHGRLPATDIARLLRRGGRLLTQQVGSDDLAGLNAALGAAPRDLTPWTADVAVARLEAAGLHVTDVREERPPHVFADIGEVVHQLHATPGQVRDFTPQRYDAQLRRLDTVIRAGGGYAVTAHRFLVEAVRR